MKSPRKLDLAALEVLSFETGAAFYSVDPVAGECCTGCVSGCGIRPTAGGCESQGQTYEYVGCGGDTVLQ
jgi:hypothetical protein